MTVYKTLTKDNYKQYEQDFLALREEKLAEFVSEIVTSGEVAKAELDFSVDSLVPVWRYVHGKIVWKELTKPYNEDKVPLWFYLEEGFTHTNTHGYDYTSLDLIDKLAYYFGEVLIQNNEGLYWEAFYEPRSRMAWQFKPVIKGIMHSEAIYPLINVFKRCVGIRKAKKNHIIENALVDSYNGTLLSYEDWQKSRKS